MLAGRIDAVKNASNYDNNSDQNQRVMRPQRGPEQTMITMTVTKIPTMILTNPSKRVMVVWRPSATLFGTM